jgi:biotin transport system permease protein
MLTLTSPVETWLHGVRAGVKLGVLCVFTAVLFGVSSVWILLGALLGVMVLHAPGGWAFARHAARMLWPVWPFVMVVGVWHAWTGDVVQGAAIILRLVVVLMAANLVTMTTRLADMMGVVEWLAWPIRGVLPPRRLALAVALVVRFIPVMGQTWTQIAEAFRARTWRRAGWRALVPMLLATIDEADHVAEALRARGGVG